MYYILLTFPWHWRLDLQVQASSPFVPGEGYGLVGHPQLGNEVSFQRHRTPAVLTMRDQEQALQQQLEFCKLHELLPAKALACTVPKCGKIHPGLAATGQWRGLAISWTPATPFSLPEAQQWVMTYSKYLHCSNTCHILELRVYQMRSHLPEVGCLLSAGADARSHETQTLFVLGFQALTLFWSWLQLRKETIFCYLHSPSHRKNVCTWKLAAAQHICSS